MMIKFLSQIDFKTAIRTGIVGSISLIIGSTFSDLLARPNPVVSSLWCVITSVLVIQVYLGGTYRAAWSRFLGLLIGTLIGGSVTSLLGTNAWTLGGAVTITMIICSLFYLQESFRIATASVAVVMILWQLRPDVPPWEFSFHRLIDSCLGILIAVIAAHTLWPFRARDKLRLNSAEVISKLEILYSENGPTRSLEDDIKKLLEENKKILEDCKPELLIDSARIDTWSLLLTELNDLFEVILSLKNAYRTETKKMFDNELSAEFNKLTEHLIQTFTTISTNLKTEEMTCSLPHLDLMTNKLKEELMRFREKKRMRAFSLEDVESFFVLFYNLKSMISLLKRIETTVNTALA